MFLSIHFEGKYRDHECPNIYAAVGVIEQRSSMAVFKNFCTGIEATFTPIWDYEVFGVIDKYIEQNSNYCIKVGLLVVSKVELGVHQTYDIFFRSTR